MFLEIYNLIKKYQNIVIARHIGVDPDAMASSFALKNSISLTFPDKHVKLAGTGTIEIDGTIGEVGGIKFKIIGAAKSKNDVFLVPKANYQEAIKTVKDNKLKLKIISVDNIEDAIEKLSNLEGW